MPYVDQQTRERLNGPYSSLKTNHPQNVGQLTYDLQQVLMRYLEDRGLSYQYLAECLGALEGAKLDLIERVVKPYEAKKRMENGDVWPTNLTGEHEQDLYSWADSVRQAKKPPSWTDSVHTCSAECPCQHASPKKSGVGFPPYDEKFGAPRDAFGKPLHG